ncbi:hypothetical protein M3147_16470 [Agromyces mediolanus]|uniref:hypothetical protein n=1 Tax=Agromyces mediolanus TaxID=41986 RepID=UPI00203D7E7E|nr:hypothetical protein [Agromyces mediolanus]MCM3658852.1 hypothetical protein [Agromyces mediolanus]
MSDSSSEVRTATPSPRLAFRYLVVGLVAELVALGSWFGVALLEQGSGPAVAFTVVAIVLHAFSLAFLLAATIFGIVNLRRRVQPTALQVLAALALPIATVLLVPALVVFFFITT